MSGHGVGAALIGSMLKIAFASQTEHLADPALVLTHINRILQGNIGQSFVTAFSLLIDVEHGILRYANAGHPPPVLSSTRSKAMRRLSNGGTILGPFPDLVYENAMLDLEQGDTLILYTDGITETMNRTEELFGDERLDDSIEAHHSESADRTADQLLQHLSLWSGKSGESALDDDLTLIVLKRDSSF